MRAHRCSLCVFPLLRLTCNGDEQDGQLVFSKDFREFTPFGPQADPVSAGAVEASSGVIQLPPAPVLQRSKSDSTDCGRCAELQQMPVQPPLVALLRENPATAHKPQVSSSGGAAAAAASSPVLPVRVTALSYVSPIKDERASVRIVSAPDPLQPARVTAWASLMDVMQLIVRPFASQVKHADFASWVDVGQMGARMIARRALKLFLAERRCFECVLQEFIRVC